MGVWLDGRRVDCTIQSWNHVTTIARRSAEISAATASHIPSALARVFAEEQRGWRERGEPDGIVGLGERIEDFTLPDATGSPVMLGEIVADGPAVVVFYRGGWCPYCNLALRTYQAELLPELARYGARLVAISPQNPDQSLSTSEKAGLSFTVLSDRGAALAYRLGIGFNGTTTSAKETVEVKGLSEASAVAAGEAFSVAQPKSGKAMTWGENKSGQLGNGTTTNSSTPVEVKKLSEATAIAAGRNFGLALLKSGKVMAWGENASGQLGNGTTTSAKEPVEVKGLSEATAIAAGRTRRSALLKSGKVMAWGENASGQLGNGTTTSAKEPVEVKSL